MQVLRPVWPVKRFHSWLQEVLHDWVIHKLTETKQTEARMRHLRARSQGYKDRDFIGEELWRILWKAIEHLHRAQRVTNVSQLLVASHWEHLLDISWHVVDTFFIEWVIEEVWIGLCIYASVLLGVASASAVRKPDIKAGVHGLEDSWLRIWVGHSEPALRACRETMLEQDWWSLTASFVIFVCLYQADKR